MAKTFRHRVVAGVDDSPHVLTTVDVAAAEAALRGASLHLVVCAQGGADAAPGDHGGPAPAEAGRVAIDAVRRACGHWGGLAVSSAIARGDPIERLIQESRSADLVVVGRGRLNAGELAPDSVGASLAAHSLCPTLVVPAGANASHDLPVLLGACASPGEDAVIAFAFEAADMRGVPLRVVHVWAGMPTTALSPVDPFAYDLRAAYLEVDRLLAEALAGWADKYPQVTVERDSRYGVNPAESLVRASANAGLVVVGPHRPGSSSAMAFGTTTRALLTRAVCPVAVVRHDPRR